MLASMGADANCGPVVETVRRPVDRLSNIVHYCRDMPQATNSRPPVVLIIDGHEWSTRSLESILAPGGFVVMRAYTAESGLERALTHFPDAVFVGAALPDGDGVEVCRTLRDSPEIGAMTPLLMTAAERPSRTLRLEALRAGAWDTIGYPVDGEELILRLDALVQAKRASDRVRDDGLMDPATGLYNLKGLERRMAELSSWAFRDRRALACVIFAPVSSEGDDETAVSHLVRNVAGTFRQHGRISDVIGRLGRTEIAVIAPSTDGAGAMTLAQRLFDAIQHAGPVPGGIELRAGYDAVDDAHESSSEAQDLLVRATQALRKCRKNGNGTWILRFEHAPGS